MNFHISYGHAAKFQLSHKADYDFADLYLKLTELKKEMPLDLLKLTVIPENHSIDVLVDASKVLNFKAFFTSLGFTIQSIRTVTTARPILQGGKNVDEILPAILGILPEEVEIE